MGIPYYWRLSAYYFFYFASLGALVPYWGLYLESQGFAPGRIGELLAVLMGSKIVAPYLWGMVADRSGKPMQVVRLTSLLALLSFSLALFDLHYASLMVVMVVFGFFWNAALPQFEAATMSHLGDSAHRYSHIRLWGSVGFIVSVLLLGYLLDAYGIAWLPGIIFILLLGIWLVSLRVPDAEGYLAPQGATSIWGIVRQPQVAAFLAMCFLMQMGHGPYYVFFSLYLEAHGYSRSEIGQLWAIGVLMEVLMFLAMHRILRRFSLRQVVLVSVAAALLRWCLIAYGVDHLAILLFAQCLHAATFGSYHAASIHLVHRYFSGALQGRGQALYSSVSFGAGGALGSLYSGYLWSSAGPQWVFLSAAFCSAIAFWVSWLWINGEVAGSRVGLESIEEHA